MARRKATGRTAPAIPLPTSKAEWLKEIAAAYCDAAGTIPFGPLLGMDIHGSDLFHMAPIVCLKFRGMKRTRATFRKATEAALSSYVATQSEGSEPDLLADPQIAFAFCYLTAHLGLDMVTESEVESVLDYVVSHRKQLASAIARDCPHSDSARS